MSDPLHPDATTLVLLGSLARHADEYLGPNGHALDGSAIKGLLADPRLREWLAAMDEMALLPIPR